MRVRIWLQFHLISISSAESESESEVSSSRTIGLDSFVGLSAGSY